MDPARSQEKTGDSAVPNALNVDSVDSNREGCAFVGCEQDSFVVV